jgi:hypothetical protein
MSVVCSAVPLPLAILEQINDIVRRLVPPNRGVPTAQ